MLSNKPVEEYVAEAHEFMADVKDMPRWKQVFFVWRESRSTYNDYTEPVRRAWEEHLTDDELSLLDALNAAYQYGFSDGYQGNPREFVKVE